MKKKGATTAITARGAAVEKMQAAVGAMSPKLRKVYNTLRSQRLGLIANSLQYYRELGEHIETVTEDVNTYGAGAIKLLAQALEASPDGLYKARSFYKNYTEDEYEALVNLRTSVGDALTWSHVIQLLSIPDHGKRTRLQEQAAKQSWTSDELRQAVTELIGEKTNRGGRSGRTVVQPKNTMQGLKNYCVNAGEFVRKSEKMWGQFFENAISAPPDTVNKVDLDQAERVVELASKALKEAQSQVDAATKLRDRYKSVLAEREPDEDDEEDEDDED